MSESTFLQPEEISDLSGVRIGKKGKTREQLQSAALTRMRIPHYVNAAGRVVVVRAVIEGRPSDAPQRRTWEPAPA